MTDPVAADASDAAWANDAADAPADVVVSTDVAATPDGPAADVSADVDAALPRFSFFVTSLRVLRELSGSQDGFGGDLRFGETGPGAGLRGADRICATIAERSMAGSSRKRWRAFLSAANGGAAIHAIDRIGAGPWYDRLGRVVAENTAALANLRPVGAHAAIIDDLPNEEGVPNHRPDPTGPLEDNHHMLTGSDVQGRLYSATATCLDWTSARGDRTLEGRARAGRSWPQTGGGPGGRDGGMNTGSSWISALDVSGCAPGVNIAQTGGVNLATPTVGSGGGYGGFYCFALEP